MVYSPFVALINHCNQIHPFTPICLCICAEFFTLHRDEDPNSYFDLQLQEIIAALRNLQSTNNLARNFLLALESDSSPCTNKSLVIGTETLDLSQITSNPASFEVPPYPALEAIDYSTSIDDRQIDFHWQMGQAGYGGV
jgi:hypothetical protein